MNTNKDEYDTEMDVIESPEQRMERILKEISSKTPAEIKASVYELTARKVSCEKTFQDETTTIKNKIKQLQETIKFVATNPLLNDQANDIVGLYTQMYDAQRILKESTVAHKDEIAAIDVEIRLHVEGTN